MIGVPPIIMFILTDPIYQSVHIFHLILPVLAIFVGIGMLFAVALITNILLVFIFTIAIVFELPDIAILLRAAIVISGTFIFGMIGAFSSERSKRKLYLQQFKEEQLHKQTITDEMTTLYNRRYLNEMLPQVISHSVTRHKELSFLMLDIDFFKQYNDTYGHVKGDEVLKSIAATLKSNFFEDAYCFRYGGEEFSVIIQNVSFYETKKLTDELIERIKELQIEHKSSQIKNTITLSIGMYHGTPVSLTAENLIAIADSRLYQAKRSGRNRVVFD